MYKREIWVGSEYNLYCVTNPSEGWVLEYDALTSNAAFMLFHSCGYIKQITII